MTVYERMDTTGHNGDKARRCQESPALTYIGPSGNSKDAFETW